MVKIVLLFSVVLCSLSMSSNLPTYVETGEDDASCLTFIPSAISPNGDGINDKFEIRHTCLIAEMNLEIFDSNGNMVFATVDTKPYWNGLVRNIPAKAGRYFWKVSYQTENRTINKEGQFVLVR